MSCLFLFILARDLDGEASSSPAILRTCSLSIKRDDTILHDEQQPLTEAAGGVTGAAVTTNHELKLPQFCYYLDVNTTQVNGGAKAGKKKKKGVTQAVRDTGTSIYIHYFSHILYSRTIHTHTLSSSCQ